MCGLLDSHGQSLVKGIRQYRKDACTKTMHGMRTDMKTIRSIFFLLEGTKQREKSHKLHRSLKKVFAAAGRIRECQLEAGWLRRHRRHALLRLLDYEGEIDRNNAAFQRHATRHTRIIRDIIDEARAMLLRVPDRAVRAYLGDMLARVREDFHAGLPVVEWHDLRKRVKRLIYARHWVHSGDEPSPGVQRFMDDLAGLQSAIGDWHDLAVMETRLHDASALIRSHANAYHEYKLARRKLATERQRSETAIRRLLTLMGKRWGNGAENRVSRAANSSSEH
jgi:CHAD domain-containing protein